MNTEIKQKWINALKSKEYQQGYEALRRDDKYCCLGVLCDIYVNETNDAKWSEKGLYFEREHSANSYLPEKIWEWTGLKNPDPMINEKAETLSSLNDRLQLNFEKIADLIERNL